MTNDVDRQYAEVLLERLKVAVRGTVPHDFMRVAIENDHTAQCATYMVATEILAERLPPETVTRSTLVEFDTPATWWDHLKHARTGAWWLRWAKPATMRTETKTATLTVELSRFWTYPDASISLPALGSPIRVAEVSDYWHYS